MELEITVLNNRLFMLLDDGWYIINDTKDTQSILMEVHNVTVRRKNNIDIVYYDDNTDDKTVDVRVFDKDGYLVSDTVTLSYEELKEASKRILEKDEKGARIFNSLNGFHKGPFTYVEYKGDKTND
jgi:hypothetical protein|nr:MAG TPA: Stimulus-sensing domain [Caudoviricetes sp.]